MWLGFTKMNGAGNDFVLVDNRSGELQLTQGQVVRLCDRQRGVGADGLMVLVPCRSGKADWAWEFYNRDGSVADMCGNGARCFAAFVRRLGALVNGAPLRVETGAGVIQATFKGTRVSVGLTPPRDLRLHCSVATAAGPVEVHTVNTGVPHVIWFVPDVAQVDVAGLGSELRWHEAFQPSGTNVNFVQVLAPGSIRVRTFERGVEGETLACGTGVAAAALVAAAVHGFASPISVVVQGGDCLEVAFVRAGDSFGEVQLIGPADFVFEGRVEV